VKLSVRLKIEKKNWFELASFLYGVVDFSCWILHKNFVSVEYYLYVTVYSNFSVIVSYNCHTYAVVLVALNYSSDEQCKQLVN